MAAPELTTTEKINDLIISDIESSIGQLVYFNYNQDFCANGFKLRTTDSRVNLVNLYVGIAYAEQPGKWSNAR